MLMIFSSPTGGTTTVSVVIKYFNGDSWITLAGAPKYFDGASWATLTKAATKY